MSSPAWVGSPGQGGGSGPSAGASLHRARGDPHIATACSLSGEWLQSLRWPKIHHGMMLQLVSGWMDPLLVKHATRKLCVLFPSV